VQEQGIIEQGVKGIFSALSSVMNSQKARQRESVHGSIPHHER